MNGSLDTYRRHLIWFWTFFLCRRLADDQTHLHLLNLFGKFLKGHLLKYDQLRLKFYKLPESEIELVALSHASYKISDNFQHHETELWRNCVIITDNISVVMIHVYVEISKNVHLFLSASPFSKVMFKISRQLVWLGGLYIIPTGIGLVLGNRISKKMFLITFGKKLIFHRWQLVNW